MGIPGFDEFLASIDLDKLGDKINELNLNRVIQISDASDPRNIGPLLNCVYQQSIEAAVKINMLNLRAYHEWLQKQLG